MGRLIDADAIVEYVRKYSPISDGADLLETWLEYAPTVDAVPVVHSEWIPKEKANTPYGLEMECAKCGFSVIVNDALYFKFCPNCGAKID